MSLLGCLALMVFGAGWAVASLVVAIRRSVTSALSPSVFGERLWTSWQEGLASIFFLLGPPVAVAWGIMILLGALQSRGRLRLPQSLTGAKAGQANRGSVMPIVVACILMAVAASALWSLRFEMLHTGLPQHQALRPTQLLSTLGSLTQTLLMRFAFALIIVSGADVIWQRWRWHQSLRMSRQECDDENRLLQGDPMLRQERARLRNL